MSEDKKDDLKDLEEKVTFNANVIGGSISLIVIALAVFGLVKLVEIIF